MSRKSKKHGEIMSDQENINQEIDENKVQKETVDIDKTSFIDSLFFSTGTIAVLGIVFVVTSFICGWYVFTLSDREKQIVENENWINAHENIIMSAQNHQQKLTVLMDSIPRIEAKKQNLQSQIDDQNESLISMESVYNQLNAEAEQRRAEITSLRVEIGDARAEISSLNNERPELEQRVINLRSDRTVLNRDINSSSEELRVIREQRDGAQGQYTRLLSSVSTFNNVIDPDLSDARSRIIRAASDLETISSDVESSSSNLDDEISDLENYNNRMRIETESLSQVSQTTNNLSESLTNSNRQLENRLTSLNQSTGDLQNVVNKMKEVSDNIEDSEGSFEGLTNTIETADRALADLVSQVNRFQKDIDDDSIKKINESIEEISKELKDLKENLEKSQN